MGSPPDALDALAHALTGRTILVTGAGLSADSGLPTYRGIGGLYDDRATDDGVPIEVALSGAMFRRDPALTWRYLRQIEQACRGARPNVAHRAIAALQRRGAVVLTQNVDGLHQAAGADVIAIHGDVHDLRCTRCAWADRVDDYAALAPLPRCPRCDAVIRPAVILFGEALPDDAVRRLEAELDRGFDCAVAIGTTAVFPYIAAPIVQTHRRGGRTFDVNPGASEVSHLVDHHLRATAAEVFAAVAARLGLDAG